MRSQDLKVDVAAADDCNVSTTNSCKALSVLVGGFLVGSFFEHLVGLLEVVVATSLRLSNMMKRCAVHALVWWLW
jgi:hypothetical protein